MQTLNRRTNLHPLIPTISPVQLLATIVQLSPSILLDWSSKILNNLGSLVSNLPPYTNQPDRETASPRIAPNVIDQAYNSYLIDPILNLQFVATWWKMMILWRITLWSQFLYPNCITSVSPKALLLHSWFSLVFLSCVQLLWSLQRNPHIAISRENRMSKFRHNF